MDEQPPINLLTPHERIAWALAMAKSRGHTPERLAERCGISRPALLNWAKPETNILAVGVGPLRAFAAALGLDLNWLLDGSGSPHALRASTSTLKTAMDDLAVLAKEEPAEYHVFLKLIHSAATEAQQRDGHPTSG
jgi:transcriptional regulator with XRE-family HTH domain